MSKNISPWLETCPDCGAEPWSETDGCWLCGLRADGTRPAGPKRSRTAPGPAAASPAAAAAKAASPAAAGEAPPGGASVPPRPQPVKRPPQPPPLSFSLATMLLMMTLAAIWLALLVAAPGIAIFLCILLLPAVVRTAMVVQRREAAGVSVSSGEKVALAVTSMFVSLVILVLALVASVGTFCFVCLSAGDESAIPVALVIAGVATLGAAALAFKWIRRRYRRDVGGGVRRP
jgi:hypothetical protein